MLLVEFSDGGFQLVAFLQFKAVSDFFWDRDDTPLSWFRVAFHLSHAEQYRLKQSDTVGFNPGVEARGSRLDRLYTTDRLSGQTD